MACDRSPGEGEGRGWRPLTRGCHEVTGDWSDKALQGRTGASAMFPGGNISSVGAGEAKRSRMPHRGCHRR